MFDKHKNHESHSSKSTKRMHTSRAALNRLLDENDASLTLTTLASAAAVLGKKVNLQLVAAWQKIRVPKVNFFAVKFEHQWRNRTIGISKFSVPSWSRTLSFFRSSPGCGVELYWLHRSFLQSKPTPQPSVWRSSIGVWTSINLRLEFVYSCVGSPSVLINFCDSAAPAIA